LETCVARSKPTTATTTDEPESNKRKWLQMHIWTVAFGDLCGEVKHTLPEEACIDIYSTIFHPFRMKHCRLYVDTYLNEAAISANQHMYKSILAKLVRISWPSHLLPFSRRERVPSLER
jgi:hypothetical protein